jgi:hypothetical protein
VAVYTGRFHALVELKTERGRLAKMQAVMHRELKGYVKVMVAYGVEEAWDILDWLAEQEKKS